MFIDGTDPNNPIYLVMPSGQYIRDTNGNPLLFSGEAVEGHESGYLVDAHGNFLFHNNAYIPSPRAEAEDVEAEGEKKEKNGTLILLAALLVIALVAAGGVFAYYFVTKDSEASPSPSATSTPTATPRDSETTGTPESPQATPSPQNQLPPEAYPGAGSADVPTGAIYYDERESALGFLSPSKNIWCFWTDEDLRCEIFNWDGTQYGFSDDCDNGFCWPNNTVILPRTGTVYLGEQHDGGTEVVLHYGQVAYNENWVCASEQNGVTCWSRASGHGFFVNRDGYKAF